MPVRLRAASDHIDLAERTDRFFFFKRGDLESFCSNHPSPPERRDYAFYAAKRKEKRKKEGRKRGEHIAA